jgi:hypothetical protein
MGIVMDDFIDTFVNTTSEIPSPEIFRRWAAIAVVAAALERRVYSPSRATKPTRPNLFITLAGMSGSGKTEAINLARECIAAGEIYLAEDNLTPAAFYDSFEEAFNTDTLRHAMCVCSTELGVLLPKYDMGFLSELSDLWDNRDTFVARRRASRSGKGNLTVKLEEPTLNILAGVTPTFLSDLLPESAWGQGFCSRMLFIYGIREEPPDVDVLQTRKSMDMKPLHQRVKNIKTLQGEVTWSERARNELNKWFNAGLPPVPEHSRLREYLTRRVVSVIKLSMISAASSSNDIYITLNDFERARDWLITAEQFMPDVFRAMKQKSDVQILDHLHYYLYAQYSKMDRRKAEPLPESMIYNFLKDQVESWKIKHLIETAEKCNIIYRGPLPGTWIPCTFDKRIPLV